MAGKRHRIRTKKSAKPVNNNKASSPPSPSTSPPATPTLTPTPPPSSVTVLSAPPSAVSTIIAHTNEINFGDEYERGIVAQINELQSSLDLLKNDYDMKAMPPRIFKSLKILLLINHIEFQGGDSIIQSIADNISNDSIETFNFAMQFDKLQNEPTKIDEFFSYLNSVTPDESKKNGLNAVRAMKRVMKSVNPPAPKKKVEDKRSLEEKKKTEEQRKIKEQERLAEIKKIDDDIKTRSEENKEWIAEGRRIIHANKDAEERLKMFEARQHEIEDEEIVDEEEYNSDVSGEEYSFDLELSNNFFDPYKFHIALFKLLRVTIPNFKEPIPSHADTSIQDLFLSLATFCDPYTQPSATGENNEMILSADLVSDLIIALHYGDYIDVNSKGEIFNLPKFDFAYDIARIIEKIMLILNADDEDVLMVINNDEDHWEDELPKWLPHNAFSNIINIASDYHHMMLLYTITTVGLLIISKLYKDMGNICLNPFLSLYLQLWKNSTRIIYLGIEIDRRDEENGFPGYPEVIRYMIKGSSAVRSMISLILNDDFEKRLHDLKHESLINFMRPWGRKFTNGSITRDIRVFVAALLALGSELDSVTELLFNFDPEDRYDEDIRYMFDMELDAMENLDNENAKDEEEYEDDDQYHTHHKDSSVKKKFIGGNGFLEIERHEEEVDDDYEDQNDDGSEKDRSPVYDLHPDCKCEFEDFDSEFDEEEDEAIGDNESNDEKVKHLKQLDNDEFVSHLEDIMKSKNISIKDLDMETVQKLHLEAIQSVYNAPSAIRSMTSKTSEVDSKGRDWKDVPRGDNQILTNEFVKLLKNSITDSTIFLTPIDNLLNSLKSMIIKTLDSKTCEKIIRSVAWVVQYEKESKLMSDEEAKLNNDPNVNADVIYNFLKSDDNFVKMMDFNPSSAFFIIDELLMAEGYRRVLIWFLTHLPLNQWLINYFHDLLIGQRGNPEENDSTPKSTRFGFSRKGALILSEVEQSMLLHEFLSNAVIYLSRGSSYELEDIIENNDKGKKTTEENNVSSFITNRSNAQKLIKVICLMLKSLETHDIIDSSDSEYRVEIQTLLVQWVGVGFVPEARELFFKYSNNNNTAKNTVTETKPAKKSETTVAVNKPTAKQVAKKEGDPNLDSPEKKEYYQLLVRLHNSDFYKLTSSLENFSSFDLFILTLNMAHHYRTEKDTCFDFMRGLNLIYHVYKNDEELMKAFDEFYSALNDAMVSGDDEKVIEIMHASRFLSNDTIIQARRAMKNIAEESDEDKAKREENGKIASMETLKLLKQFPLEDYMESEKQKKLLLSAQEGTSGTSSMNSTASDDKDTNQTSSNGKKSNKRKSKNKKHK